MIPEKMQELLILMMIENNAKINSELNEYLNKYYDIDKINERYSFLLMEFLTPYALDKTEKSD